MSEHCDLRRLKSGRLRCRRCGRTLRVPDGVATDAIQRVCLVAADASGEPRPLLYGLARWPCVHRGPVVGSVTCDQCGLRGVPIDVAECALHGHCVASKNRTRFKGQPLAACDRCGDRVAAIADE